MSTAQPSSLTHQFTVLTLLYIIPHLIRKAVCFQTVQAEFIIFILIPPPSPAPHPCKGENPH